MLHGIYGRGRNWQAIAKALAAQRPDWGALLIDLRLHGESRGPDFTPPHTLARAAEDVAATLAHAQAQAAPHAAAGAAGVADAGAAADAAPAADASAPPDAGGEADAGGGGAGRAVRAVLGHSFGGKVALALAAPLADTLAQIWVIDSTPEARAPAGSAWGMLEHVRALPATFGTRAEAIAGLEQRGWATGVATWMATNLRFDDGQFRWALDFDGLEALLRSFFDTDLWSIVEQPPGRVVIHFVKAEQSHTLSEEACARIQRAHDANGRVHLHRVAGGHWLNTDNPQAIIALLAAHLPREARGATGG
jgi:esterase